MTTVENYPQEYKFLPIELMIFFSGTNEGQGGKRIAKTVSEFCSYYKNKYKTEELPQPRIVSILCDKLVATNRISSHKKGGFDNMDNSYFCILNDTSFINNQQLFDLYNSQISFEIYDFKFIYDYYRQYILPVIYTDCKEDISIGSSFLYRGGILTAKHCIEGAKKIAIQNISSESLKSAKFYTLSKASMDLLFIKFAEDISDTIYFSEEAEIMEEVLALGFPKIPGFHKFLTAEKALISSKFTGTKGTVNAIAEDIWIRENLILITAKIRGGNSGGPIINSKGKVVGVASSLPTGEGKYDDLGYGTVIPISFGNFIIDNLNNEFDTSRIEFVDFTE